MSTGLAHPPLGDYDHEVADEAGHGILGQRTHMTWTLRSAAHSVTAITTYGRTLRKRWLVLGAAALATDPSIARAVAGEGQVRPCARLLIESCDAALWARSGDLRGPYIAAMAPAALESGYRLGAGTDAVPVPVDGSVYPPCRGDRLRAAARVLLPIVAPAVAARWSTRRRTHHRGPEELWGVIGTVSGFALARFRDRLQRQARNEWGQRAQHQIALEAHAAQVRAATVNSEGHSFKKVLVVLAYWGSGAAKVAASEQMERPRALLGASGGMTISDAAFGITVEPPTAGVIWLSTSQVHQLRQFLDDAELEPCDARAVIDVTSSDWSRTTLTYLGHHLTVEHPPPTLLSSLDPLPAGLVYGAVLKAISIIPALGGLPVAVTLASAVCDLVAVQQHRRHRTVAHQIPVNVLPAVLAGTLLFNGALAAGYGQALTASGAEVVPATNGTISLMLLIGQYWESLGDERWLLLAAAVAIWTVSTLSTVGRTITRLVAEAFFAGWVLSAVVGLGERIRAEAGDLERVLQDDFVRDVIAARHGAVAVELHRYQTQLDLARTELARLGSTIPDDIGSVLRAECDRMQAWLADPAIRASLESWS